MTFDHGSLRAHYDLRAEGMEQSFAFDSLPAARGEVAVRVAVATGLAAETAGERIALTAAEGAVTYGAAVAIDGRGRRLPLSRRWRDGGIDLVVPAEFVADATLPLVIDPLVGTSTQVTGNPRLLRSPDVVYDATAGRYMVCCELVFSATDSDVYSYELAGDGSLVASSFAVIDSTGAESWQDPRIANNNLADRNLVVAQVSSGNTSPFSIRGRTRDAGSLTRGAPFDIAVPSSGDVGDKIRPDVGGDPHIVGPTYFTVVWEWVFSATDYDVHARQMTSDLNPALRGSGSLLIDNSNSFEETPQISDSAGAPTPNALFQKWMVVYRRRTTGSDIRGRLMRWDGTLDAGFSVSAGDVLQHRPSVSTVTAPDGAGNRFYPVAWEQGMLTDGGDTDDIHVRLCTQASTTVSPVLDLQELEGNGSYTSWQQVAPVVAGDGCRFAVAYAEDYRNPGDFDVRVTTLHPVPTGGGSFTLGVSEGREWPASRGTVESQAALCSRFGSLDPGSPGSARYMVAWHDANGTADNTIRAQIYDGYRSGGGFSLLPHGCGATSITYSGRPVLGERIQVGVFANVLLAGIPHPRPFPLCAGASCLVGVFSFVTLPPAITVTVPCDGALIGGTIAFQGVSAAGGPCFGSVALTDTLLATIE